MRLIELPEYHPKHHPTALTEQSPIEPAFDQWRALLGEVDVFDSRAASEAYGANTSGVERRVAGALRIRNSDTLPAVMRIARAHRVPVYPISTGRNWGYGSALPAAEDCVVIDLSALQKILHFDAKFGVVTVEPGVTQAMLADFLDEGGHPYMVPVTGAGPRCSLIGNALERGYGFTPYADHFSAITDLEAVLADGSVHRTMLREAGGEDLARLYKWGLGPYTTGLFSQSGLGIVTRMSLMLAPRPECMKVCVISLNADTLLEPTVERVQTLLARLPGIIGGINLMNRHRVLAMAAPYPADEVDSHGLIPRAVIERLGREYRVAPWTAYATLYGTRGVVQAAEREIKAALRGVASRLVFISPRSASMLDAAASWLPSKTGIRRTAKVLTQAIEIALGRPNELALPLAYWRNREVPSDRPLDPARDGCGLLWYAPLVPMRASGVRSYVDMVQRVTAAHGIEPLITFTSVNDKVFDSTVPLLFDRQNAKAGQACYEALLSGGEALGCFPYRFGIDSMKHLRARLSASDVLHARLRHGLDPENILAPGRYL